MGKQTPPKIEFPCAYPIKVLGRKTDDFKEYVLGVMCKHAGNIDESLITERQSGKGTFTAVTVVITATGKEQLEAIFEDLKSSGRVKMVL